MKHQKPYRHLEDQSDFAQQQRSGGTETEKVKVNKKTKNNKKRVSFLKS